MAQDAHEKCAAYYKEHINSVEGDLKKKQEKFQERETCVKHRLLEKLG
jgi:hypothetical protein